MKPTIARHPRCCHLRRASIAAQAPACAPSGGLTFICGVQNPEDLVVVPNTRWMLASGMAPGSGLHLVDTQAKTVQEPLCRRRRERARRSDEIRELPRPARSEAGMLHGLSLRSGGKWPLHRVRDEPRRPRVGRSLRARSRAAPTPTAHRWVGCVLTPDKMAFNSVAAFSDGSLVATVLITPDKTFEDAFAQRITGVVMPWTPGDKTFQLLPGTELSANNGIETSPDDREFYVASTTTKRIIAFARNNTANRCAWRN